MKSTKPISDKNTKQEILEAYQEIIAKVNSSPITDTTITNVTKINKLVDSSFKQQIESLEEDLNSVTSVLISLKKAADQQRTYLETEKHQTEIERTRLEEEYNYQFGKTKKRQEEELKEQKTKADEEISAKKALLRSQEDELTDLRNQAKTFEARLQKEVNDAIAKTSKELKTQFEHEKVLAEQVAISTKSLLEQKIISLEQTILSQKQEVERLNTMAIQTTQQMTRIAERAVTKSPEQQNKSSED